MDVNQGATIPQYQRLTLFDLTGLVAAFGLGLGFWIVHARDVSFFQDSHYLIPESLREWINLGSDEALAFAWLVLLCGLARPRPRPMTFGSVACLAVVLVTMFGFLDDLTREYHETRVWDLASLGSHALLSYVYAPWDVHSIAGAVILAWFILARTVGWQRAHGSLDWVGRGVGLWFLVAFGAKTVIEVVAMIERMRSDSTH